MEKEIQHKMDEILNGFQYIQEVEPSPFLWAKIQHKVSTKLHGSEGFTPFPSWKLSLAFVLIMAMNIGILTFYIPTQLSSAEISLEEESSVDSIYEIY